jgi:class 3 adenylate cyclase
VGATAAAASGPSGGVDAVRKTVTVLFADLEGSTGFGERTDPEVARQVLARYHALLQEAIDAHRGTVAKFMGDGMMATFGIPEVAATVTSREMFDRPELREQLIGAIDGEPTDSATLLSDFSSKVDFRAHCQTLKRNSTTSPSAIT